MSERMPSRQKEVIEHLKSRKEDGPLYIKSRHIVDEIESGSSKMVGRIMRRIEEGVIEVDDMDIEEWGLSASGITWRVTYE